MERQAGAPVARSSKTKKTPWSRYKSSTGIKFKSYVDVKEIVMNSVLEKRLSYKQTLQQFDLSELDPQAIQDLKNLIRKTIETRGND
jgi:hypothetical protein